MREHMCSVEAIIELAASCLLSRSLGLRQPRRQNPHELRRRLDPDLRPRVRQVSLDGGVRQAGDASG